MVSAITDYYLTFIIFLGSIVDSTSPAVSPAIYPVPCPLFTLKHLSSHLYVPPFSSLFVPLHVQEEIISWPLSPPIFSKSWLTV